MKTMSLEDFPELVSQMMQHQDDKVKEAHGERMEVVQDALRSSAPVRQGTFRRSILPFGPAGQAETVTSPLNGWEPGMESGHSSFLPYSRRIAFGHSSKAPKGWIIRVILKALS